MSKATKLNFSTLENPYNGNLDRGTGESDVITNSSGLFGTIQTPRSIGEVDKEVSGQDLTDLWISSWIKSRGYKPKVSGFLLDGKRGYIECMKLYVGGGGIEGGSIHIPNETANDSFHSNSYGDSWWGCNVADLAANVDNAKAYILKTGQAKFQNIVLSNSVTITGIQSGSEIAIQGWQQDMTFSATDYRIVAWASGTITLLDGTTYSITGANTGNMATLTYIYLDIGSSETVLQTTTTASDAIGSGKILIGVAQNNSDTTSKATYQVFGGKGGNNLLIDNIAANSACVNELISNSAQIANATIANAHITGTITVGHTDADVTADNAQDVDWLTDSGAMAKEDVVEKAKLGTTILLGGYLKTGFVDADRIDTGTLVVGRTQAKCTVADADKTSTHTADDTSYIGGHNGWVMSTGYLKSLSGAIELKGSTTPHIKAISLADSNDFVQMTAQGDTPRFDVYESESSTYHLRLRVAKDGISFRTGVDIEQGKLYGYYVDATTKGLYADVTYALYSSHRLIAEHAVHSKNGHNFVGQDQTNVRTCQVGHSGTSLVTGDGWIGSTHGGLKLLSANNCIIPNNNEISHLGTTDWEWADVWAANTTIQHGDVAEVEKVHPLFVLSTANIIKEITAKYQKIKKKQIKNIQLSEINIEQYASSKRKEKMTKHEKFQHQIKVIENDTMNEDYDIKKKRVSKISLGSIVAISDKGCLPTNKKGQTNILGVVSTAPGIKLDSHAEGIYIAKVGKVPCRVIGKCKAGDLIQSSDKEGCAEKSENPKTGSIIGRAKENKTTIKEEKIKIEVQMM